MKLEGLHRIREVGRTFEVHRSKPGATEQVRAAIDRRIAKIDRALDQVASPSRSRRRPPQRSGGGAPPDPGPACESHTVTPDPRRPFPPPPR